MCPSSHWEAFPPCLSRWMPACLADPFPHGTPEGTEPEGEGRSWQLQEDSRCAWVLLPWDLLLALSAGCWKVPLRQDSLKEQARQE